MFGSIFRQDMEFHDQTKNKSYNLLKKLSETVPYCTGLTTTNLALIFQVAGGFVFNLIFSLMYCPKFCVVFLVYSLVVLLNKVLIDKLNVNKKKLFPTGNEKLLLKECIINWRYVTSYCLEKYLMKVYKYTLNTKSKWSYVYLHFKGIIYSIYNSLVFLIQAIVFNYGLSLIFYENLSVLFLFKFYALMELNTINLVDVYNDLPDYKQAKRAANTVFKIIERKSMIDPMCEEGLKMEKLTGDIEFKNVDFYYPQRPNEPVLQQFNLFVKHGQTNVLVGKIGCGKSTIISLLLRFYDVTNGVIMIGGIDIKRFNVKWLRSQIGVVSQEPVLFNTSIKENILFGDVDRKNVS